MPEEGQLADAAVTPSQAVVSGGADQAQLQSSQPLRAQLDQEGHAAAVVFVRKPDWPWCLCLDYWGLNSITEPLVEPLPHIDTLLEQTRGCAFFLKINLALAYHQIRL